MNKDEFVLIPQLVVMDSKLSVYAKAAYAVLASYAGESGTAVVGRECIGLALNVSARRVGDYLKELVEAGWIDSERQGVQKANRYRIKGFFSLCDGKDVSHQDRKNIAHQETGSEPKEQSDRKDISLIYNKDNKSNKEIKKKTKEKKKTIAPAKAGGASAKKKKLSHDDISILHIAEAKEGRLNWDKVSDRDLALYFIRKHNERFSQFPIVFNMYRDVGIMRDCILQSNNIPRDKAVEFIDLMIDEYHNLPNRYDRLSFNMLSNRTKQIVDLMDTAKKKLIPVERRFKYNQFGGEIAHSGNSEDSLKF
jgi:hypothetical protein